MIEVDNLTQQPDENDGSRGLKITNRQKADQFRDVKSNEHLGKVS